MAFLIQRRAASCHCHHRHFMTTLTVLPPSLALLQLATQGQLKVCASCPVAQPNAASLGKACRLCGESTIHPQRCSSSCNSYSTCNPSRRLLCVLGVAHDTSIAVACIGRIPACILVGWL